MQHFMAGVTYNKEYSNSNSNSNPIIRRSMSADMSSPKWVLHNMNRVQSSHELQDLCREKINEDENVKNGESEDIWSSIHEEKRSWSSIFNSSGSGFGSGSGSGEVPPPYVHPLVRRSGSSLSEKSLEICTESLGSETGSDGFSYTVSEPEEFSTDDQFDHVGRVQNNNVQVKDYNPPNHRGSSLSLSLRSKSFHPPLTSLAQQNGSNIHMRSHRHDGRLVLEAVSIPSNNCFRAHRQDGRLLLTLVNDDEQEEEEEEEEEVEDVKVASEDDTTSLKGFMLDMNRLSTALVMKKLIELTSTRNNSTWRRTINTTIIKTLDNHEEEKTSLAAKWLPPCCKMAQLKISSVEPTMSTTTVTTVNTFNNYEYYWRQSTTIVVLKSLVGQQNAGKIPVIAAPLQVAKEREVNKLVLGHKGKSMSLAQQRVVLLKAEGAGVSLENGEKEIDDEYLVPLLRGCKEPRNNMKTSLLFWEPYCIAIS